MLKIIKLFRCLIYILLMLTVLIYGNHIFMLGMMAGLVFFALILCSDLIEEAVILLGENKDAGN